MVFWIIIDICYGLGFGVPPLDTLGTVTIEPQLIITLVESVGRRLGAFFSVQSFADIF